MNERIRELTEQATITRGRMRVVDTEKFAELLIRKCACVGLETHGNYDVYDDILNYFGLEELEE